MELGKILPAGPAPWRELAVLDMPALKAEAGEPGFERRQVYLDAFQVPVAVIGMEAEGLRCIASNRTFRRAAGEPEALVGELSRLFRDFLASSEDTRQVAWREEGVGGRHYRLCLSRLPAGDGGRRALVSMIDRTAEIEAARALRAEMLRDGLTGLPNRAAFVEALESAIEAAAEEPRFALLAIDLARFSRVNEGVGALAGDELILTVAHRLRSALAPDDLLARTAGDEFGVLVWLQDDPGRALEVANRLRESLLQPIHLSDFEISVDCAIGCALWGERTANAGDVLGNVQVALKRAKTSGLIETYQPGEVVRARRRFSMETDLRRAIERDELSLAFQPLLSLDSGRVTGFEALARWTHPEHGVISPAEFIPVAEESGLVVALGRWALDRAGRTLLDWDRQAGAALPLSVSVNVSAVQLARDDLVAAVDASGIDTHRLTLELTESSIIADPERAVHVLGALTERRCAIAMDDFGTGHSCLAYLQRLPLDVLKIDRSFVADMHLNRDSMAIVRAVLSLARSLGLSTTAEGIELPETAAMLGALGCATGQGFHFSRPLPPADAIAYFRARNA